MAGWWKRLFGKSSSSSTRCYPPGCTKEQIARIDAQFDDFDRQRREAEAELRANPYHPDPGDNPGIEAALRAAPPEAWQRLWSAVDEVLSAAPESQGTWRFKNRDGSLSMPHVDYSDAIYRMNKALYDVDAIVSFSWTKWNIRSIYPGGHGLDTAPVADAARVLTAVVNAERFSDGTILAALSDGLLPSALQRLRSWYEQQTRP
ncbi:DUF6508 domain-containing protein [Nocardia sp. CA-128927]|uniref:DUF6508 domain-containing protein n=1 Tax=Nocardia sp. CA-128927 TaxID=3239975 RepID=UPI003D96C3C2